jgi:hypothetical protein
MGHGLSFTDSPKIEPAIATRLRNICAGVGIVGILASAALVFLGNYGDHGAKIFYFSYLTAYFACVTVSLGCLFYVIIHHLTRATWSTGFRRVAENVAGVLPWAIVGFIPVALGAHDLYHWTHAEAMANDPILQGKAGYLNEPFFYVRAVIYLLLWSAMAIFFRKMSVRQDESGDTELTFRMRWWAPLCTLGFALTVSYAAFDWLMGLNPHWFSTMFGVIAFAGGMVSACAMLVLLGIWLQNNGALSTTLTEGMFHDLGKLMWGFMIFWTYTSFSQYFLIWYGNIPEETEWFLIRMSNGWENVGLLVIFGHFIFPLWFLMSRHVKRNRKLLGAAAVWMLFIHYVDIYYIAMPNIPHDVMHGFHPDWLNLTTLLAVGGCYGAAIASRFTKDAVVPYRDPQLNASMNYDNF